MKFYLTQPTYAVTIRYFGGAYSAGDYIEGNDCDYIEGNDLDKVREAGLKKYMESRAHEGGYFYFKKIQYINGDKLCGVVEMLDFKGSEEDFYRTKLGMEVYSRIGWFTAFDKYGKGKSKKELAKQYLMHNLVIDKELLDDIQKQPAASINLVGGVASWYCDSANNYHDIKTAISVVDYKYPNSERVWSTVSEVWEQVAKEKLAKLSVR